MQMFAVFKAFAEQEMKEMQQGSKGLFNTDEDEHPRVSQTKRRIIKVMKAVALKDAPSKHALSGPLPPGIRELLTLRRKSVQVSHFSEQQQIQTDFAPAPIEKSV